MANRERIICDLDGCEKEYAYRVKGFNLCSLHALGERRLEKQAEDDYLECSISPRSVKWVTDSIVKGRRIALLGIGISICQHGDKIEMRPEIPAIEACPSCSVLTIGLYVRRTGHREGHWICENCGVANEVKDLDASVTKPKRRPK